MTPCARCALDVTQYGATGLSTVLEAGRPAGTVLGCKIEAQFDTGTYGIVLLVSADSIFVGLLHILLVREGRIVERLRLGDGNAQGLATEIQAEGADGISFRFPFDEINRLRVEPRSSLFGLRRRTLHLGPA